MARIRRVKPDDELTLVEHLDELRVRLIVSLVVLTVAVAGCYYESHHILHFLTAHPPPAAGDVRPDRGVLQHRDDLGLRWPSDRPAAPDLPVLRLCDPGVLGGLAAHDPAAPAHGAGPVPARGGLRVVTSSSRPRCTSLPGSTSTSTSTSRGRRTTSGSSC